MKDTLELLRETDFPAIRRAPLQTLQVNVGYLCNQQCLHCHVDASPRRKEIMDEVTIDTIIEFMRTHPIKTLDLTGGAPELNPHFRKLVSAARELGVHVIDRCNLTVLLEEGMEWLPAFLYDNEIEIIASMPCYLQENVDAQRGKGVFDKSLLALKQLNELGYGKGDEKHPLNLVYNPQGPHLPPAQEQLQQDYKRVLKENYDIDFDHLFTLANMPIKRFGSTLVSKGEFDSYMALLKQSHQAANVGNVMCRSMVSIDWQGYVYDCDFNQMLGLNAGDESVRTHLSQMMERDVEGDPIVIMDHCYGCTAGQGSSCGGALA